jgi:thymidine kinase
MTEPYLEIIVGPMFSGKTSRIIELYNQYMNLGTTNATITTPSRKVVVINFYKDTRYHETMLSTHDNQQIPCIMAATIEECSRQIEEADVILINEGQFFPDLLPAVHKIINTLTKRVHVCGLDGDFKREKFGKILDLIPYCDNVIKLKSRCVQCGCPAIFSARISSETEQLVIGSENYKAVCRKCYEV